MSQLEREKKKKKKKKNLKSMCQLEESEEEEEKKVAVVMMMMIKVAMSCRSCPVCALRERASGVCEGGNIWGSSGCVWMSACT